MPATILSHFQSFGAAHDEDAAYRLIEACAWPGGATCPHCGMPGRNNKLQGATTRIGTYKCYRCRKPFTVKMGTAFEGSHVRLHLWLRAIYLFAACRKPVTAYQLCGLLDVSRKTATAMIRRMQMAGIRPAVNHAADQLSAHAVNGKEPCSIDSAALNGRHHANGNGPIVEQINGVTKIRHQLRKRTDVIFERFVAEIERFCADNADELFKGALNCMLRSQGAMIREPSATLAPLDRWLADFRPSTYSPIEQPRRVKLRYT